MKVSLTFLFMLSTVLIKAQLPLDTAASPRSIVFPTVQNKHYITAWNQIGTFDTVIIKSTTAMNGTFLTNTGGTASQHWVVMNEGGPVITKGGMDCYDIRYIDFYGYGSADDYGFIFNAQNAGFAFPLKGKSHHVRFFGVLLNGGTQEGFTAKIEASDFTDYKCDTTVGRFVQTGLYYENCKVRYNGGESWYMNSTGWDSRDVASCAIGPTNAFEGTDAATVITNSGTFTNKVYIAPNLHNANKTVTVVARITRVSGTIAGNATVFGSNDGATYTSLQTQALTNVATNTYNFSFTPSLYRYYRIDVVTSGTMSANLNSYINFYFKPPPSDSITITKSVMIAPGRSGVNYSNMSHAVFTFNKGWHQGRELNTSQGRMLACGGAVISPIVTDNKCFGSFHNNFWFAAEGNIIFDRNYGDSSGFYATTPNLEQNAAVQVGITTSRNTTVTWKIRNNNFYHGSGGGGSIQYVLYPGPQNTDTGNVICNNLGNGVLCGSCLSLQPNTLVYSTNCGVANTLPIANAGPNGTITLPTDTYNLNGSAQDLDGNIASTVWSKLSGPTYTISDATKLNAVLSNLLQGTYFFILTVTDNLGGTDADTMRLVVNPAPVNNPPVAGAGTDITIQLPTNSTQLAGTASDDVGVSSTVWTQTAGTAASISNVNILTPNITGLTTAGTRTFRLIVTDGGGLKDTDFVNVIVLPAPNVPPVVNAGNDTTINLPSTTVNLNGSASDGDGTIASTLWSNTDGCSITTASSLITTATCTVPGPHVFTLVATDNSTATTQDQFTATMVAAANVAPTAIAANDTTIYLPKDSLILNQSGTDGDGTIAGYLSTIIQTSFSPTILRFRSDHPTLKNFTAGDTIKVLLRVTDDDSAFGYDTTTIIILDTTNNAPTARINLDTTIYVNPPVGQIGIDGSSSFDLDPGDYIAGFLWTQVTGTAAVLTGETTSILHINGMVPGVYGFRLTVTDSRGLTDPQDFTITVTSSLKYKILRIKTRL